jgi:putative ABC transport system substrate-binding protein
MVTFADPLTVANRQQIVDYTTRHRLPMVSELRQFAAAGALMSYGASLADLFRRAAGHVDKILEREQVGQCKRLAGANEDFQPTASATDLCIVVSVDI